MGRGPQIITAYQQDALDALDAAAQERKAAEVRYREAVLAARETGVAMAAIGRVLGISVESVRLYLNRHQAR